MITCKTDKRGKVKSMVTWEEDKNGSGTIKSSSYNIKRMMSGWSKKGSVHSDQYVFYSLC